MTQAATDRDVAIRAHTDQVMAAHREAMRNVPATLAMDVLCVVMAQVCFMAAFMVARGHGAARHGLPQLIHRCGNAMFSGWHRGGRHDHV